jgi:hypothetical protein
MEENANEHRPEEDKRGRGEDGQDDGEWQRDAENAPTEIAAL